MLLERGADVNRFEPHGIAPLAAAIRLQSQKVFSLLEDHGLSRWTMPHEAQVASVLDAASEVGESHIIKTLLLLGDKINTDDLGKALVLAIRNGQDEIARILIEAGANVDFDTQHGECGPPIYEVLKQRNEALVILLLDADAQLGYAITTSIALAVEWCNRSVIEAMIFAGAPDLNKGLAVAVKQQNTEIVQLLVDHGADVNNRGARTSGRTPLSAAVENGDIDMVQDLFDLGADPDDSSALEEAMSKSKELIDLLFERYNARYPMGRGQLGTHLLIKAISKGETTTARRMLEKGVNMRAMIDSDDQECLKISPFGCVIAQKQGRIPGLLEHFLQNGCSPNEIVSEEVLGFDGHASPRVTAFLAAIGTQDISIVKLFLNYEADVNFPARLRVKRTPLQRAAEVGSLEIVELLINYGANINAPAAMRSGGTALQLAAIGGYARIVCELLNRKADVHAPASKLYGRTALEGAAEHGRLDVVQILINAGAGSRPGDKGEIAKAQALAKENGFLYIYDLLEDHFHKGSNDAIAEFTTLNDDFSLSA